MTVFDYVEFLEERLRQAQEAGARKTVRTEIQIEIATARLLNDTGYHALSVDMIADAAGMAHGTFYRYFSAKRDVVAKTMTDYFEFVRASRPRVPANATDYEAVLIGTSHYVRCFSRNVGLMRCHFHLKDEDDVIAAVGQTADYKMTERVLRRMRKHREVADDDVPQLRLRIFCLISMVDELLLKVYGRNRPPLGDYAEDPDMIARTLAGIWHSALYDAKESAPARPSLAV